ncbi:MAG: hypothetical protein AVO34_08890 [Firmicutes bacterium ML8_F2]|nr:MAG: hypothetical protein AVO34_08890 [Firmicutes bacterium ML8_F2]
MQMLNHGSLEFCSSVVVALSMMTSSATFFCSPVDMPTPTSSAIVKSSLQVTGRETLFSRIALAVPRTSATPVLLSR